MKSVRIGIPIYPGVDLIDVIATWDTLYRISDYWKEGSVDLRLIAATDAPVTSGQRLQLKPDYTFRNCLSLDVLLVPGTQDPGPMSGNEELLDFLRKRAKGARYVMSVCTGAILLAAAGLLDGYRATTHALAIDTLKSYQKVIVANGYPRYVECGNRFTTGGVSSAIDGSLRFAAILTGDEQVAKSIQLVIQYNPKPPYDCGDPYVADFRTYDVVTGRKSTKC
jgi:cyclohexyl-isocyanide hydratase